MTKIKANAKARIEQSFGLDLLVTGGTIFAILKVIAITTGMGQ